MRILKIALTASLLLATSLEASEASQWQMPTNNFQSQPVGLNIVDSFFNTGESISRLEIADKSFTDWSYERRLCEQMGIVPCDGSFKNAQYFANEVLPPCTSSITEWCIEGLRLYSEENSVNSTEATLIRSTQGPILRKDISSGLPQGGTISLWRAPGQINSGKADTYAVYLYAIATSNNGIFNVHDLRAMILPYSEKTGPEYVAGYTHTFTHGDGKTGIGVAGGRSECAWTENGICGFIEEFPQSIRASLSVRIGNTLSGWIMGRMANPKIQVTPISSSQNRLTVDSEPITVPKFFAWVSKDKLTDEISALDPTIKSGNPNLHNQLASQTNFDLADAWAKFTDGKAAGQYSVWSMTTTLNGRGSNCLADTSKLLGFVSTNSALYEGSAPGFSNGALNYKVWSQHYASDGSIFKGRYDLIMRSETARCLYGFTNAPISASISITSTEGSSDIETTVVNEKDGWLYLSANGFTFSSPTIQVKLKQAAPSVPKISETAPAKPVVKTISCSKGKAKKIVMGINPKCPSGYKKS